MIISLYILLIFLLAIFQVSFLSHFQILQITPNLILAAVISWCILKDYKNAFLWALGGGLLLDLFSGIFFGFYMITYLLAVLLVYYLISRFINTDTVYSRIGIMSLATVVLNLFLAIFFILLGFLKLEYTDYLKNLWYKTLIEIVLNVVSILVIYGLIKKIQEFVIAYKDRIKIKT